jgi:transcriptional regulator with XRE-family HTH domain
MNKAGKEEKCRINYQPRIIDYATIEKDLIYILGNNMRKCRIALGLNREQMASKLRISSHQYRKYEEGKNWMQIHTIMYFILNVGMPFTHLFSKSAYSKICLLNDTPQRLVPIQAYIGRCTDKQFELFRMLIDEMFGKDQKHSKYNVTKSLPQDKDIDAELNSYYSIIAKGLKMFRSVTGLSTQKFADLLGIDRRTLIGYEKVNDNKTFSVLIAMRFWASTGVHPIYILRETSISRKINIQMLRASWLKTRLNEITENKINHVTKIINLIDPDFAQVLYL